MDKLLIIQTTNVSVNLEIIKIIEVLNILQEHKINVSKLTLLTIFVFPLLDEIDNLNI